MLFTPPERQAVKTEQIASQTRALIGCAHNAANDGAHKRFGPPQPDAFSSCKNPLIFEMFKKTLNLKIV